mmetsp:Transcript_69813/g.211210  ORF Transcript_69813/g.211210 Transcript_69813/m.211210 type:complete len:119 (+) Transcript_69813:58-414(+)
MSAAMSAMTVPAPIAAAPVSTMQPLSTASVISAPAVAAPTYTTTMGAPVTYSVAAPATAYAAPAMTYAAPAASVTTAPGAAMMVQGGTSGTGSLFDMIDRNHDGIISRTEFQNVVLTQ